MAESVEALETIDLLYQAALDPALWRQALHRLALTTGGIGSALIPITPGNITGLIVSPELDEPNIEYDREWWRHDTRVLRIHTRRLKGGVCCEAELFTDDELARDPLRQEFLRRYGIGAFAAQLVAPLPNLVVAFSVQRALERGEFEKRELAILNLLGRHAARALVVGARLAAARQLEQTVIEALAQFDCGALVVDRDLKILHANPAALQLVGDGLSINQGHLGVSSREHKQVFVRFMRAVLRRSAGTNDLDTIALPRPSGRRPLLLQAVPISAPTVDWSLPSSAAALVIVVDPERDHQPQPAHELRLLGLTPSEARLAVLIGTGHSRAEAAQALGITQSTVSDVVKNVYLKLGISRQSELVRLIDRLAVLAKRENAQGPE